MSLKKQLDATYSAFHAAEQKGLFSLTHQQSSIQLKPIIDGPLAQRRHHKRSTSSNASSESNLSSNSICSSLSTSTTSTQQQQAAPYVTPTKKCPSSCGKQQEPCVFDFADDYVSEYLQQQHDQHQQHGGVFNRPITRSITHHNSRLGAALNETVKQEEDALITDLPTTSIGDNPPFKRQKRCSTILID